MQILLEPNGSSKIKLMKEDVLQKIKAKLVAQGYYKVKGIDFDELFAPIARLESICLLLSISCL